MLSLPVALSVLSISLLQTSTLGTPADVSTLKVSAPMVVAELDLGKLKGELRQIGWSSDGTELYVETVEGKPPSEKLHDYTVPLAGGAAAPLKEKPDWADNYWAFKSDRFAPGLGSLMIDFEQKLEKVKVGTGSGRPGEMAGGAPGSTPVDIEKTAEGQHQNVARLTLLGETISEFVNETVVPGLMFSWGPAGSGAIAFTDRDGRLFLFDQKKHKQSVAGAKDALLPAWTMDGSRLVWAQKSGRKKYRLVWAAVSKG